MRILQVVNVRWFNATAWYGLYLSRLLRDAGHEVVVLGLPDTDSYKKALEWGLDVRPYSNSANPLEICRLSKSLDRLVKTFRPHVVNCHRGENYVLWCLKKNAGSRFALVRTRGDQRPPASNFINRWLYTTKADAVIATNSAMTRALEKNLALSGGRVRTVIGGVDRERFRFDAGCRAELRARLGFDDSDLVFGLLGRFDPVKGHRELIRALALAKAAYGEGFDGGGRRPRLLFVGRPANLSREDILAEFRAFGVEGVIVEPGLEARQEASQEAGLFAGPAAERAAERAASLWNVFREGTAVESIASDHGAESTCRDISIPAFLSALDVGVVNSQGSEAIARAALEIMSCGVPLIGTDVGVMPDLLESRAMTSPGDREGLAELLGKATREEFRNELKTAQAERLKGLSGQEFMENTLRVYGEALRRGGCSGADNN